MTTSQALSTTTPLDFEDPVRHLAPTPVAYRPAGLWLGLPPEDCRTLDHTAEDIASARAASMDVPAV
ncbi:hypothetical protein ACWDGI_20315 [Streptomyces sp. NPDC001220]